MKKATLKKVQDIILDLANLNIDDYGELKPILESLNKIKEKDLVECLRHLSKDYEWRSIVYEAYTLIKQCKLKIDDETRLIDDNIRKLNDEREILRELFSVWNKNFEACEEIDIQLVQKKIVEKFESMENEIDEMINDLQKNKIEDKYRKTLDFILTYLSSFDVEDFEKSTYGKILRMRLKRLHKKTQFTLKMLLQMKVWRDVPSKLRRIIENSLEMWAEEEKSLREMLGYAWPIKRLEKRLIEKESEMNKLTSPNEILNKILDYLLKCCDSVKEEIRKLLESPYQHLSLQALSQINRIRQNVNDVIQRIECIKIKNFCDFEPKLQAAIKIDLMIFALENKCQLIEKAKNLSQDYQRLKKFEVEPGSLSSIIEWKVEDELVPLIGSLLEKIDKCSAKSEIEGVIKNGNVLLDNLGSSLYSRRKLLEKLDMIFSDIKNKESLKPEITEIQESIINDEKKDYDHIFRILPVYDKLSETVDEIEAMGKKREDIEFTDVQPYLEEKLREDSYVKKLFERVKSKGLSAEYEENYAQEEKIEELKESMDYIAEYKKYGWGKDIEKLLETEPILHYNQARHFISRPKEAFKIFEILEKDSNVKPKCYKDYLISCARIKEMSNSEFKNICRRYPDLVKILEKIRGK